MKIISIIPARMGSSRFPGKPLAKINNKPMIGHVFDKVSKCKKLSKTVVATCDEEIFSYIHSIGGEAVMTSKKHERASDRCAEALKKIEKSGNTKYDIMVMVQGDEPMINQQMINEALEPFYNNPEVLVSNLISKIKSKSEFEDRNCIKVVCDKFYNAIYFSREPIPTLSKINHNSMYKQVCVIPFRRDFLFEYNSLDPTPLEIFESIDMMRVIENGLKVKMIPTKFDSHAVDTPNDLKVVEKLIKTLHG